MTEVIAVGKLVDGAWLVDVADAKPQTVPDDWVGMDMYLQAMQESGEPMDWDEFDSWANQPGHRTSNQTW